MKTIDWLNNIIKDGLLCDRYITKVYEAKSKKQLFNIICDANGVSFLPEMREKGYPLEYDVIEDEFGKYINGRCCPEYTTVIGKYSSALYCRYNKELLLETTIACFCGCELDITIPQYSYSTIYIDQNSKVRVHVKDNSHCKIYLWGECSVDKDENSKVVIVNNKGI